ncbi:MAG TPA: hypothetical protein VHV31_09170, partial [Nitrolancea sp.]|nr:hypothetical protein [Nitrolancea sp.]
MRRPRIFRWAAMVGLVGLMALAGVPMAAAKPSQCRVINNGKFTTLQAAQDAASAGDTLQVHGMCTGTTTIDKNLTVTGKPDSSTPTLDGGEQGTVLTIVQGVTVTIKRLTITGGTADTGGGIVNSGTLILNDSIVSGNTAQSSGGGIENSGTVTLNGSSAVTGNRAASGNCTESASCFGVGGGIANDQGTVILND